MAKLQEYQTLFPPFSITNDSYYATGTLPPTTTTMLVTATSVTVLWTQPPFSFTPVEYTVSLKRVTGHNQSLCTNVNDSRPVVTTMPNVTAKEFVNLHEYSIYEVTVTANFHEFGLPSASLAKRTKKTITTLSTRKHVYGEKHSILIVVWVCQSDFNTGPQILAIRFIM